jgi:hypothetical protein
MHLNSTGIELILFSKLNSSVLKLYRNNVSNFRVGGLHKQPLRLRGRLC